MDWMRGQLTTSRKMMLECDMRSDSMHGKWSIAEQWAVNVKEMTTQCRTSPSVLLLY